MTEREREETALFRFGVIGELTNTVLGRGEKARVMREKSRARYRFPDGREGRLSRSTLKAWLRAYGREGLDGLKPKPRADRGTVRALRPEVQGVIRQVRVENPGWGVPEVMSHLRETGILASDEEVSLGVVYRLIGPGRTAEGGKADRRKYGFEKALECVQADVMYGPPVTMADGKRRRSYLHVILDDCTRLVLHGEFMDSERATGFEHVLKQALLRRGHVPARLYTDNGAAFVSHSLQMVCARLGVVLIHTQPGEPEGRGKIERFFRRVREQFLSRAWREGMTLVDLNAAFWEWVEMSYHRTPHQGLGGETPLGRWMAEAEGLGKRRVVKREELEPLFRHQTTRRVNRDRTFQLRGKVFEAPVDLVGERIEVFYNPAKADEVEVVWGGRSCGFARPLDLHANRHVRRGLRFDREGGSHA